MKVSHILYKVNDLEAAVREWREKGYAIEYGRKKNPYNALVYFSEGPYLEVFQNPDIPRVAKKLLSIFGKKELVKHMNYWKEAEEGLVSVALENYEDSLEKEIAILRQHGIKHTYMSSKREDIRGNLLEFKVAFPDNVQIPFMMTYFNIDPKPKNFVHPNGTKGIKSISFGTEKKYVSLIEKLCDDPILKLHIGKGVKDMEFIY